MAVGFDFRAEVADAIAREDYREAHAIGTGEIFEWRHWRVKLCDMRLARGFYSSAIYGSGGTWLKPHF